jgi:methionyl-tRNA synthetase
MTRPADSFERTLVTSALPYANGPIHIGHLAGAYLPADLFVRYQRLRGRDIAYICGSDEHGVPIMLRAREEGISPQEVVDRYHADIKESFEGFGMSFDHYGRTSSQVHRETSREFFRRLSERDIFVRKTEEQLYDPEAEIFLADRLVRGTCPICGYEDAYGDQCEECGSSLSPSELIDPRSAITSAEPVTRETTHWYMPLGRFQAQLEEWIDTHPEWKPNVLGQVKSWFTDGLKDRAMTRDLPWGIEVPEDIARQAGVDPQGKVFYVWFDAPIGYISSTKEWAAARGNPARWEDYWKDENTRLIHFVGKDNIVFHCLIFPAMLMAHGEYVVPDNVPANEFLNLEGRKLSTSRGWAVWLEEYLEEFPPDLLRYALATTLPETKDADFSWEHFQARVNSELADVLGNFVNRTMTFATRYFDGVVPPLGLLRPIDQEVLDELSDAPEHIGESFDAFRMREGVSRIIDLARTGNRYFNDTEPWHTRKDDREACATTIHVSLQICAALTILMEPVLPFSAERMREMLQLKAVRSSEPGGQNADLPGWEDAGSALLEEGHALGEPEILFSKIEDSVIEDQIHKLERRLAASTEADDESSAGQPYADLGEEIGFEDFAQLDLRVGEVIDAGPVAEADKLLRVQVDIGFEQRQVLAGVAKQMSPEELVGQKVVLVANLAPKKMFGHESQGMILMAEDRDGTLTPVSSDGENGAVVR